MYYAYLSDYLEANNITAEDIASELSWNVADVQQYIATIDSARTMDTYNRQRFADAVNAVIEKKF